jgi:hypothetical protein
MKRFFALFAVILLVSACSSDSIKVDPTYPDQRPGSQFKKGESIFGDGGLDLFNNKKKDDKTGGIGVNAYLWRASLDTVSFMPINAADPFGGTIITDWTSPGNVTDERLKANIIILDRQLRADSVRVSLFRQVRGMNGQWQDAEVPAAAERQMEDTILTRARELKVKQEAGL